MPPVQSQAWFKTTTIIVPALNEATALPQVLSDIPDPVRSRVIVVDNGSSDDTHGVARRLGALVVREPRRGYGSAMSRGLEAMRRHFPETEIVVFLDADRSDFPERMGDLVEPIVAGRAELVLASRSLGARERGALPAHARFGNRLACFLIRRLTGARYTDLGPFRAIRRDALGRLGMRDPDFGWTVEMQLKAARAGLSILEVPLPYRRRLGQSKISGTVVGSIRAGVKILVTIARYRAWRPDRSSPRAPAIGTTGSSGPAGRAVA